MLSANSSSSHIFQIIHEVKIFHSPLIFYFFSLCKVTPDNFHSIHLIHIFYMVCVCYLRLIFYIYDPWCPIFVLPKIALLLKSMSVDFETHRLSQERQQNSTKILEPVWKRWYLVDDDIWDHIRRLFFSVNGNLPWHWVWHTFFCGSKGTLAASKQPFEPFEDPTMSSMGRNESNTLLNIYVMSSCLLSFHFCIPRDFWNRGRREVSKNGSQGKNFVGILLRL